MSAIEHQDEIVEIGGVDRLDRGVGDRIEDSAIVVLVVTRIPRRDVTSTV